MRIFRSLVCLTTVIMFSHEVFATEELPPNDAVVHGYIVDANTKKPIPGVVVTASNNKKTVEREVATNAAGYFRLEELPEGSLEIKFDKKGYKRVKKDQVSAGESSIQRINIDLISEKLANESPAYEYPALRLLEGIF